jgi:hypothetical protein
MVLKWFQMTRAACKGVAVGSQYEGNIHFAHASSHILGRIIELWKKSWKTNAICNEKS